MFLKLMLSAAVSVVNPYVVELDPATVGTLALHLSAEHGVKDGSSVLLYGAGSSGVDVQTWEDQSGNGNHFTAASSTVRPSYAWAAQNGKPGIQFDGVDEYLRNATFNALADGNNCTIIVVCENDTDEDLSIVIADYQEESDTSRRWVGVALDTRTAIKRTTFINTSVGTVLVDNTSKLAPNTAYCMSSVLIHDTELSGWVNGVEQTNSPAAWSGSYGATGAYLGVQDVGASFSNYLNGFVYEILVYAEALSDSDRVRVEQWLMGRWGL